MENLARKKKSKNVVQNVVQNALQPPSEADMLRAELMRLQLENAQLAQYQHHYFNQYQHQIQASPVTVIQSPNSVSTVNPHARNLYLAGYMGADDWQRMLIDKLKNGAKGVANFQPMVIFNPRKEEWKTPVNIRDTEALNDKKISPDRQFSWEIEHLEKSNCAVFYFAWDPSVNNVASLLQLGRISSSGKQIFICIHSRNKDKGIIYEFIKTRIPNAYVTSNLEKLFNVVQNWVVTGRLPDTSSQGSSSDDAASVYGR